MSNKLNSTRKVKTWNKMTEKEFNVIKALLAADIPVSKVAEIQDRAYSTIKAISESSSLEQYLHYVNERAKRNKARAAQKKARLAAALATPVANEPEEVAQPIEVPAKDPSDLNTVQRMPRSYSEVRLDRIANALERLVDAWERQPQAQPEETTAAPDQVEEAPEESQPDEQPTRKTNFLGW